MKPLFISCMLLLSACRPGPPETPGTPQANGRTRQYLDALGQILPDSTGAAAFREVILVKGVLEGEYTEYALSGQVRVAGQYQHGNPSGTWKYFGKEGHVHEVVWQEVRLGALCTDNAVSHSTGQGTCSGHGGVKQWVVSVRKAAVE